MKYAGCLDAEKECMTNPAGNGYRGTMNMAASGRPCTNWTCVENYTITASLPIDDISKAKNYCRRVPFTEWNGPSCVTEDEAGMVRLERCDVRYCGKLSTFYCTSPLLSTPLYVTKYRVYSGWKKSVCNFFFLTVKNIAKTRQTSIVTLIIT